MHLSIGTPHDPWGPDNVPPEYCAMFADEGQTQGFTLPPNYKPKNDPYADAGAGSKARASVKPFACEADAGTRRQLRSLHLVSRSLGRGPDHHADAISSPDDGWGCAC
jgi:hypothetical protein